MKTAASYLGTAVLSAAAGYSLKPLSAAEEEREDIRQYREETRFKREYDGHVWLRSSSEDWFEIRLDAKVPGTVLLRHPSGQVHYVTFNNIQQIDLTDDYVVMALFAGGSWEQNMQPLQARNDKGAVEEVKLDQETFRDLVSLMS